MRYPILIGILGALLLFPVSAAAQSKQLRFDVPFSFVANDTEFPAGECVLRDPSVFDQPGVMTCGPNNISSFLRIKPDNIDMKSPAPRAKAILVFERVNDYYFLRTLKPAESRLINTVVLAKRRQEVVNSMLKPYTPVSFIYIVARH